MKILIEKRIIVSSELQWFLEMKKAKEYDDLDNITYDAQDIDEELETDSELQKEVVALRKLHGNNFKFVV